MSDATPLPDDEIAAMEADLPRAIAELRRLRTIVSAADKGSPIYKAVERVLDEHSAWVARPNVDVARAIALAAGVAWMAQENVPPCLMALRPCVDRSRPVIRALGGKAGWEKPVSAARLREVGASLDDMVWLASAMSRGDKDIDRRLRLWMADCAARVLHIYERDNASDAPRKAIIAARQFARGEIADAARDAARDAAWAAARAAARDAAWAAARAAARDAAWAAARAARDTASDAAWAARAAASDAARDAEEAWQFDRLIARLSDPEPEDWPLPEVNE